MSRNTILYTGTFRFPDGDAAAMRVLGIGKALREAGFDVVFGGWQEKPRDMDRRQGDEFFFDDFKYYSLNEFRTTKLGCFKRLIRYARMGHETLKWVESRDPKELRAVICYHGPSVFLSGLHKLCRKRGIPLIADITEWHGAATGPGGRLGPARLDFEYRMRVFYKKLKHLIVISKFLENYYTGEGRSIIRVPPLIDLLDKKWPLNRSGDQSDTLKVVFAGQAGLKDFLGNAVRGFKFLGDRAQKLNFIIVGPSRSEVQQGMGTDAWILEKFSSQLCFTGRLPHVEALKRVGEGDFSIILRPKERYAEAGFPTKLVESLSCGVPVIANLTSDIGDYVHDNVEGLVLRDFSTDSFVTGINRAFDMSMEGRRQMRVWARDRAAMSFDYRNWVEPLKGFMAQACKPA
jgi:glycosyltransferase involved in cell wall biosynthesis